MGISSVFFFFCRIQWKNQDMINAMKAVTEKKMTIRGAAKKFNVPYRYAISAEIS